MIISILEMTEKQTFKYKNVAIFKYTALWSQGKFLVLLYVKFSTYLK